MKKLEELKGEHFAIQVENNETAEIEKQLKEAGYFPEEDWNDHMREDVTHIIVYTLGRYEFHNHSGTAKIITL